MSFQSPLVLLALIALPLLIWAYRHQQRRRERAAEAFVMPALRPSVAPRRPRWRRQLPMLAFLLALAILIVAAARPQRSVAVPVDDGAIMLATDVSSSMTATDVAPTRLAAARAAEQQFVSGVPSSIRVGLLEFANKPIVLQTPSTEHSLSIQALGELHTSGGTAIGDALLTALRQLNSLRSADGKRPPAAIVLASDGASNVGSSSLTAAHKAAAEQIPVYTIALGTDRGTIPIKRGSRTVAVPVPPSPQELAQIAGVSGGRAFTAADAGRLSAVYAHLAAKLGHKHVQHEISSTFAGGGLVLLLLGSAMSLRWFGRLV